MSAHNGSLHLYIWNPLVSPIFYKPFHFFDSQVKRSEWQFTWHLLYNMMQARTQGRRAGGLHASWANYFKIMQFFTKHWVYTPNFGFRIRIFLWFAPPLCKIPYICTHFYKSLCTGLWCWKLTALSAALQSYTVSTREVRKDYSWIPGRNFYMTFWHHCLASIPPNIKTRADQYISWPKMWIFQLYIDKIMHIEVQMQLLKEAYAWKRIHNGGLVRTENSITRVNCLALHGKPHDAQQLPLWQNFQSAHHNH